MSDDEILFAGASQGGRIQEFTWDGTLVWDFKFHDERYLRHHAITRMPNGNVMMIVWERKTAEECIAAGVDPDFVQGDILVDCLIEVEPQGKTDGRIVWEWHIWDHLIQDHDKAKANYGDVAEHPELIDANYARSRGGFLGNFAQAFIRGRGNGRASSATEDSQTEKEATNEAVNRLRTLGYIGGAGRGRGRRGPSGPISDWNHVNAVSYNAALDQLMISPREFNEVWIVDHSTTTAEAASHRGGRSGKGGDLLYRWGNPEAYRAGTKADQRLFSQHDTQWIGEGLPGAGHMLVFSNGGGREGGAYSSVDEVILPVDAEGNYAREAGKPFGPDAPVWSYTAEDPAEFFAPLMSGAQRLPNGNTLICTGFSGDVFEVTPNKKVVWKLVVPEDGSGGGFNFGFPGGGRQAGGPNFGPPGRGGAPPGFAPPGFGPANAQPSSSVSLLPGPLRFMLELEPGQIKEIDRLESDLSAELENLLTVEQLLQLDEIRSEPASSSLPSDGKLAEVLSKQVQQKLKLADDQMSSLAKLQSSLDEELSKIVTNEQKERLESLMAMAQQFLGGGPNAGPPGRGRGPGGFPGAFGFGGTPGAAGVFRAYRYGVDYPGLVGRDLTPGKPFVEFVEAVK